MTDKKGVELLRSFAREKPTVESTKAETMFRKFMNGGFSYDELSSHPDYPVYASAEVLATILPLIIDEMFARGDTGNFLIYHVITAIDPFGEGNADVVVRAKEIIRSVDKETQEKVYKLLMTIKSDPPIPVERLDKIIAFWESKTAALPS